MDEPTPPTRPEGAPDVPASDSGASPLTSTGIPATLPGGIYAGTLTHVAGYEILDELGRGGWGVVYRALQLHLGRTVALKVVLHGDHAGTEVRTRFRNEARAIARLQHPNIVAIYEIGETAGLPFFSMEYCAGGSLSRRLAEGPMEPREAAALVRTLALAVQVAHDQQVIHRDLKPANILLGADGTPKVADFGLARRTDAAGQTASGAVLGTPSYMAPEQARGKVRQLGPAVDVYALGAILYECLTGRPPFLEESSVDTLMAVVSQPPIPPRQIRPDLPEVLEAICLRCLEKVPADRPASARQLAEQLEAIVAGRSVQSAPLPAQQCRKPAGIRRPVMLGSLFGLLCLVVGIWLFRPGTNASSNGRGEESAVTTPRAGRVTGTLVGNAQKANLYGVLMGINNYSGIKGFGFGNLRFSVSGTEALAQVLQLQKERHYSQVEVTAMIDRHATRSAILGRLDQIAGKARPQDWVIVFLSGHGYVRRQPQGGYEPGSFFFLCADTDANSLAQTASWQISDLKTLQCKAGLVTVLLHIDVPGMAMAIVNLTTAMISREGVSRAVFTACSLGQAIREPVLELGKGKGLNGFFTSAIIEALDSRFESADSNGDGQLDLRELQAYVLKRLRSFLKEFEEDPNEQTPTFFPSDPPPLVIARDPKTPLDDGKKMERRTRKRDINLLLPPFFRLPTFAFAANRDNILTAHHSRAARSLTGDGYAYGYSP